MNMILVYEGQRDMLINEQHKINKELKTIQEAGARMGIKTISYMNELIDYLMFLEDRIEILDKLISTINVNY